MSIVTGIVRDSSDYAFPIIEKHSLSNRPDPIQIIHRSVLQTLTGELGHIDITNLDIELAVIAFYGQLAKKQNEERNGKRFRFSGISFARLGSPEILPFDYLVYWGMHSV